MDQLLIPLEDTLILAGCLPLTRRFEDRELLVRSLCHFILIDRVHVAIQQLANIIS